TTPRCVLELDIPRAGARPALSPVREGPEPGDNQLVLKGASPVAWLLPGATCATDAPAGRFRRLFLLPRRSKRRAAPAQTSRIPERPSGTSDRRFLERSSETSDRRARKIRAGS